MRPTLLLIGVVFTGALALGWGCKPQSEPASKAAKAPAPSAPTNEAEAVARGKAVAAEAFAVLSGNLQRALSESGPAKALHFCSVHAAPLAGGVAATNEVLLKRISLRVRNIENQPSAAEVELLSRFAAQIRETGEAPPPVVSKSAEGRFVFYAPITLNNPLCLQCHGDPAKDIAPDTMEMIKRLYPNDRAIGFQLGDLRGAWRIEFLSAAP
jgi:Protein of unknown function (DUF3365)